MININQIRLDQKIGENIKIYQILNFQLISSQNALFSFEFSAKYSPQPKVVVPGCPLVPVLDGRGVEIKAVVNVHLPALRHTPDYSDNLVILISYSHCVGITTVIKKGHCGEYGASNRNYIKLGYVIVLKDAFCNLQSIC